MNDVTILFPLSAAKLPFPEISLQSKIAHAAFADLTDYVYQNVRPSDDNLVSPQSPRRMTSWHIVALRVDPCFLEDGVAQCVPQVRLVAQPLQPGYGLKDQSIHLLYQISADELLSVTQELQKVKQLSLSLNVRTSGKSLQPHPGLVAQMSQMSKAGGPAAVVQNIAARYCTLERLRHVTMTGGDDRRFGFWIFVGGDVVRDRWVPQLIPNLNLQDDFSKGTEFNSLALHSGFVQASDDVNTAFPAPYKSMQFFLKNGSVASATREDLKSLFEVMNPKISNPKNTDCASCHLNSTFVHRQTDLRWLNPFRETYKIPPGITGFARADFSPDRDPDSSEVRVLGYDQEQAVITPLVAVSSADVAERLNNLLQLPAPTTRDCSDFKVFECFNKIGSYFADDKAGTDSYCLRLCK